MIVVDTSAVLAALAGRPTPVGLRDRLARDGDLHAPHLIDVEVVHALRRLVRTRHVTEDRAVDIKSDFTDLAVVRYPHQPLVDRMWQLRNNLSAYDATFVALSEVLGVPLVTCDGRLAASTGHQAEIELFLPS
ncbi:MAG: type II toxin-antitoxin system VapC family toxin [Actinomycetota bacterium]